VTIRELVAKFGLDFDARASDRAEVALRQLKNVAIGVGTALVASKVTQTLKNIVVGAAQAADSTDETAQSIGTTAAALQGLGHAAQLNGSSQEELAQGLAIVSRQALAAKNGSKEAGAGFHRLGVRVTGANGQLRSSDELFLDIADAMQKLKSPTERTALAMQVFGRGGARLIPTLLKGRQGIMETAAEVRELGAAFDEGFVQQSSRFTDNLRRMGLLFEGVRNTIARALMPVLSNVIERFIAWRKANAALINQALERWAGALVNAVLRVVDFGRALYGVLQLVGQALPSFTEEAWLLIGAIIALGLALGFPAVLIAALGAGFVLALEDLKVFAEGGDSLIGRLIEHWEEWVASVAKDSDVLGFLLYLLDKAGEAVAALWLIWTEGWDGVSVILDDVVEALKTAWEYYNKLLGIDEFVGGVLGAAAGQAPNGAATNMFGYPVASAAAAPEAAAAGAAAGGTSNTFKADFNVTAAPGQDPREVAVAARQEFDDWFQSQLNSTNAALTPAR
jgi:hypothetical protein